MCLFVCTRVRRCPLIFFSALFRPEQVEFLRSLHAAESRRLAAASDDYAGAGLEFYCYTELLYYTIILYCTVLPNFTIILYCYKIMLYIRGLRLLYYPTTYYTLTPPPPSQPPPRNTGDGGSCHDGSGLGGCGGAAGSSSNGSGPAGGGA